MIMLTAIKRNGIILSTLHMESVKACAEVSTLLTPAPYGGHVLGKVMNYVIDETNERRASASCGCIQVFTSHSSNKCNSSHSVARN